MRDLDESCGANRVARTMRTKRLRAQPGYGRRLGKHAGKPAAVAPNHLQREFSVLQPKRVWVTDILYIRTHERWLYLAVALELFSRREVGWSMRPRIDRELALNALLMAVRRHRPTNDAMELPVSCAAGQNPDCRKARQGSPRPGLRHLRDAAACTVTAPFMPASKWPG
jgi:putative transposase